MAEKKIDNAEVMTEEQLDQVAGGTYSEFKDIRNLLPKVKDTGYDQQTHKYFDYERYMDEGQVEAWLSENLGITANISTGWFGIGLFDKANTYSRNNQSLTHEEVVKMVKEKLGK